MNTIPNQFLPPSGESTIQFSKISELSFDEYDRAELAEYLAKSESQTCGVDDDNSSEYDLADLANPPSKAIELTLDGSKQHCEP